MSQVNIVSGRPADKQTPIPAPITYNYKVRVINHSKKSDVKVRLIHQQKSKFMSVSELRQHLITEFGDLINWPRGESFDVGFMEGSHQTKIWLENSEDLDCMYKLYPNGGNITLWCYNSNGESKDHSEVQGSKRKRDTEASTRRQEKEEDVDKVYKELREMHGNLESTKLRLWSRMICGGLHDDYTVPPDIPVFSPERKKPRKENMSDALTGAAVAICKALSPGNKEACPSTVTVSSPSKAITLRMKNYEQLKYLKQLSDEGILDDKEYMNKKC